MPARVVAVGAPVNEAERTAIGALRDALSDRFTLFHNFEVTRGRERFEVDLAVLAPHALYLVDLKGTRGTITVRGGQWDPAGRAPYPSPLLKLRGNARALKGLIVDSDPGNRGLRSVYVDAIVVLTHPTAQFFDPHHTDAENVVTLDKAAAFFRDASRIPSRFSDSIGLYYRRIEAALLGSSRASRPRTKFGSWAVEEKLSETAYNTQEHLSGDDYQEYRAHNAATGADHVRLRVYPLDPYADEEKREAQRLRIANTYEALAALPPHPAIVGARDFFHDEAARALVLVTDDVAAEALGSLLQHRISTLTPERRVQIARDFLSGLAHAHGYGVIHRALSPGAVLVAEDGRASLTGFDVAKPSDRNSTFTVAEFAAARGDERYQAPELFDEVGAATPASDVFAAGAVLYELVAGKPPFKDAHDVFDRSGRFAQAASAAGTLPDAVDGGAFDAWLQSLCAFDPNERPSAKAALAELNRLLQPPADPEAPPNYRDLPQNYALTPHLIVQERLGQGGFATVYRVFYELADSDRVVKIVDRDRVSQLKRVKQEFQRLLALPDHPHIVKTHHADSLPDGTPYILLDYLEGHDVRTLIKDRALTIADAWELTTQVADALKHIHRHNLAHADIKPSNILWTADGARLIDFNVASSLTDGRHGGGQRRYLPPDVDLNAGATREIKIDRDVFALGCTLFEAVTGRFPYPEGVPRTRPLDPRSASGLSDLSDEAVDVLTKAVAPKRSRRFESATALASALKGVARFRRERPQQTESSLVFRTRGMSTSGNPFISYLRTLYSQTSSTNAGTRGLDEDAAGLYVETLLDRELAPAVLNGELRLVVITGNAGDGKTAFLQRLERNAEERGATRTPRPDGNGATLNWDGRTLVTNYDGSQDEGDKSNAQVLRDFLNPFEGDDPATWPNDRTHLIAINEGRLVDFLETEGDRYPALRPLVERGAGHEPTEGVAVVNLNLRSVTARAPDDARSIFRRLLKRFSHPSLWAACDGCPVRERCYARYNATTFADPVVGPHVAERLETLYRLTTLRGRLHITVRDLGSALAYTLTSDRDCAEIQALYAEGDRDAILSGYYFNAWMGGAEGSADRLLSLLREADVGIGVDPNLDRQLDFRPTGKAADLFEVEKRGDYPQKLLDKQFEGLSRGVETDERERIHAHRNFVSHRRRLAFFERRDDGWRQMLPFEAAASLLHILAEGSSTREGGPDTDLLFDTKRHVLEAINRAEGLAEPEGLNGDLALQIRNVRYGTIRSYRVFPADLFQIAVVPNGQIPFLETEPTALELSYHGPQNQYADLRIDLDLFELLDRLNRGYQPSPDDVQGRYLSLVVFKNLLSAAPYDELLLTRDGDMFYRVYRTGEGRISLKQATASST